MNATLSVHGFAKMFGVNRITVRRALKSGALYSVRIGPAPKVGEWESHEIPVAESLAWVEAFHRRNLRKVRRQIQIHKEHLRRAREMRKEAR